MPETAFRRTIGVECDDPARFIFDHGMAHVTAAAAGFIIHIKFRFAEVQFSGDTVKYPFHQIISPLPGIVLSTAVNDKKERRNPW
jgi:hypothetical protein